MIPKYAMRHSILALFFAAVGTVAAAAQAQDQIDTTVIDILSRVESFSTTEIELSGIEAEETKSNPSDDEVVIDKTLQDAQSSPKHHRGDTCAVQKELDKSAD